MPPPEVVFLLAFPGAVGVCISGIGLLLRYLDRCQNEPEPPRELTLEEINQKWAASWERWRADVGLAWPPPAPEDATGFFAEDGGM